MSGEQAVLAIGTAIVGFAVALAITRRRPGSVPPALLRTNVEGRTVPATLGGPLLCGALLGTSIAALAEVWSSQEIIDERVSGSLYLVSAALAAAGLWDDLRGDERPRGFKGHLRAARGGRLTGGLLKLIAGGLAGLAAGAMLGSGWFVVETGLLIALSANLLNLLDRAPGRAGKVALLWALAVIVFGNELWIVGAAGMVGALVACLPADLHARAMLGDMGANHLGGVLGLGLALSLSEGGRLIALGVLVLLNLLSERYSFSRIIERTPPLRWFDELGRTRAAK